MSSAGCNACTSQQRRHRRVSDALVCCRVLQSVAEYCSLLQSVAVQILNMKMHQCVAVYCSVLLYIVVYCSLWQCGYSNIKMHTRADKLQQKYAATDCNTLQYTATDLQCDALRILNIKMHTRAHRLQQKYAATDCNTLHYTATDVQCVALRIINMKMHTTGDTAEAARASAQVNAHTQTNWPPHQPRQARLFFSCCLRLHSVRYANSRKGEIGRASCRERV